MTFGTITKNPSGRWRARYRDRSGKQRSAGVFRKKIDAQRKLAEIQQELERGTWVDPEFSRLKLRDWLPMWLDGRVSISSRTVERNKSIVNQHLLPKWGEYRLSDVRHSDVQEWIGEQYRSGKFSPATIKKHVQVLSAAYEAAVKQQKVAINPVRGVEYPKGAPTAKVYLTPGQVRALAEFAGDDRREAIVYTLAYTGLRWGELAGLRVKDLDAERGRLNVEQTISYDDTGRIEISTPKDNEHRSVPVYGGLLEILRGQAKGKQPDDLLFTSAQGKPLRLRNERRWFDKAADAIGVEGLTPHKLRHTAASIAISGGASVLGVQRMLGHASPTVTLNTYAALFDTDLDEVGQKLSNIFAEAAETSLRLKG